MTDFCWRYTDFLKDEKFLRWQLLEDESLNDYWENFVQNNPQTKDEIEHAISYLKKTALNANMLSDADRSRLLDRIQSSIEKKEKRKKIGRIIQIGAAACIAIAFVVFGKQLFIDNKDKTNVANNQELIVGNLLKSEDIQLITGDKSRQYNNNIDVKIDGKGNAKVLDSNKKQEQIKIDQSTENKLIVPYGKRTQLNLSDGTKVWLNSGSVLIFPTQFSEKIRSIELLSGEIYLEVAHDSHKSFIVNTHDFKVKVYGTKFNISAYEDSPKSVVLVEGSIGLQSVKGTNETKLSPNEQAIVTGTGTFSKHTVDVTTYVSWKNGYLSFDETPMTEVLKQIGRYYNLSFNFDKDVNLQKRTCSGKIYLSDNLDNVMTTIGLLTSTRYIKQNGQIYILNEK
jgi:hypothetical protein